MEISVVIPLYNEENIIPELLQRTISALEPVTEDFEIICIDDGSTDSTLAGLLSFHNKDKRLRVLELSRNFGHQAAYTAGLAYTKGEYVVMLDGDLQDPPELVPEMYKKIREEGLDIVYGKRTGRKESLYRKIFIKVFHYIFKRLSRIDKPADTGNFSIMNRAATDALLSLREKNRYIPGLRCFIGFNQGYLEYERSKRKTGKAKMGFVKLTKLAFDAIFSFSRLPIRLSLIIGTMGILLSLTGTGIVIYKKIIGVAITGWTSEMLSMYFFGSVQLFFLGILGEYVFRIFIEAKNRPIYIVRKVHE